MPRSMLRAKGKKPSRPMVRSRAKAVADRWLFAARLASVALLNRPRPEVLPVKRAVKRVVWLEQRPGRALAHTLQSQVAALREVAAIAQAEEAYARAA